MKGKMKKITGVAALFLFLGTIAITTIDCASTASTPNTGPSGPRGPSGQDNTPQEGPADRDGAYED